MKLNLYNPTDLEQWITLQYQQKWNSHASDLDNERITSIFNTSVLTSNSPLMLNGMMISASNLLLGINQKKRNAKRFFMSTDIKEIKTIGLLPLLSCKKYKHLFFSFPLQCVPYIRGI
jgi:hypothetical protein